MRKMINKITIEGIHYENDLKKSDKGYINGKLSVLIPNEEGITNVCDLRVIAGAKYGNKPDAKKNDNFPKFEELMNSKEKAYLKVGNEATGVSITGALEANYFIPRGAEPTRENVVSTVNNNASFIDLVPASMIEKPRAEFEMDIVITSILPEMSKDPDCPAPTGNYIVKGYTFNYRNVAIEVSLIAKTCEGATSSAADYFAAMASELPVFTKVWGKINGFVTSIEKVEESAFGEAKVVSFKSTKKEFEITGALATPYEDGITEEELKNAINAREMEIAVAMDRQKKPAATPTASTDTVASAFGFGGATGGMGGFHF